MDRRPLLMAGRIEMDDTVGGVRPVSRDSAGTRRGLGDVGPIVAGLSPVLAGLCVGFVLIWALYADMFRAWWGDWTQPGSYYAHAVFVPIFVAVMIHRNWNRLTSVEWRPAWFGLMLILAALAVLMPAKRADVTLVKSVTLIIIAIGSAMMLLGARRTRVLLFPILFVLTMIPLFPDQLINVIAFPIQLKSTQIATTFLNLLTLHAARQGTMIQMDSYKMAVEGACSGFKTLVSLLTFAAAFAYLVEGELWKRWLLFCVTAPLSLVINALRITLIGVVGELISSAAAGTFHDWSGFFCLILAFLFLFNFARLIRCKRFLGIPLDDDPPAGKVNKEPAKSDSSGGGSLVSGAEASGDKLAGAGSSGAESSGAKSAGAGESKSGPPWWEPILAYRPAQAMVRRVLPFVVGIDVALVGACMAQGHFTNKIKPRTPIGTVDVPLQFGYQGVTWKAEISKMMDKLDKNTQDQLNPQRIIARDYSGTDGSHIELFMTAGNGRWTFHDPHNCSLGSDASLTDIGIVNVPTKLGDVRLLEVHYKRMGDPSEYEMMYCYVSDDMVLQRTEQVHKHLVWQMWFGDAGKPSYYLRFTFRDPGTEPARHDHMMHFVAGLWEQIGPYLMGKKRCTYEPPPVPAESGHSVM
jgi:exosortase